MIDGKYVIIEHGAFELPILFSPIIEHGIFRVIFDDASIVSAGFFAVRGNITQEDEGAINVAVSSGSVALDKEHRKEDAQLIKKLLRN